jgi:hypothetical protein
VHEDSVANSPRIGVEMAPVGPGFRRVGAW